VVMPLPDIVSKNNTKQEEFTFYKTLTDKDNKTVSIDLKQRATTEEASVEKKQKKAEEPRNTAAPVSQKDNKVEIKNEKAAPSPAQQEPAIKNKTVLAKKEPTATTTLSSKVRYTLQIASYQEKEMAEDEVKKMKKQGYAAFIVLSQLPDKGTWYRVRLGSFTNKAAAEKLKKEIHAKAGVSTIVVME
jgi:DedD protein